MNYKYKPYHVYGTTVIFADESLEPLEQFTNVLNKCDTLIFKEYDYGYGVCISKKIFQ